MADKGWIKKAVGEMASKLRGGATGLFGQLIFGKAAVSYRLNSSKVSYKLARELYKNTNDDYKLGAGFAKPIVNTIAGFMGVPAFKCIDEDAQETVNDYAKAWRSRMLRSELLALRDGDCYVFLLNLDEKDPLYPESSGSRLDYVIVPPEQITDIIDDPLTGKPIKYVREYKEEYKDDSGTKRTYEVKHEITKDGVQITVSGDAPAELTSRWVPWDWGFIPIEHFKNEAEESEKFGTSELESVEPFFKAYHDVMLHALQGSKMHSTPRLKLKLADVEGFIKNNFGDEVLNQVKKGQPADVNLEGHELVILQEDDDAEFIEVTSATGSAEALLHLLFYCIVDASEVPEFAFGVHTPSSHASVREQMPMLIRRVNRKREQFAENWQRIARMVLAMTAKAKTQSFSTYAVEIVWDEVIERDEKEYAETIKTIIEALSRALDLPIPLISQEAAVNTLSRYIDTMQDYIVDDDQIEDERTKIMGDRLTSMRLEDGQFLEEQLSEIDELLEAAGAKQKDPQIAKLANQLRALLRQRGSEE